MDYSSGPFCFIGTDMSTDAETSQLNLKLDPVEFLIFSGIQKNFLRVFNSPSVWVTSDDRIQALKKLFRGSKVTYPFCYLHLDSIEAHEDGGHPSHHLARKGSKVLESEDRLKNYNVKSIPAVFTVQVQFVTNSYADVLSFANRWLFARRLGWLKFQIAYGLMDYAIAFELDSSVPIPTRTGVMDDVQEYVLEVSMRVFGFISNAELIEVQQGVPVIVASLDDPPLPEDPGTFWTYSQREFDSISEGFTKVKQK